MSSHGYVLEYDAEYRWLVMSDPEGASEIVARDVRPDDAAYLIAGYNALTLPLTPAETGLREALERLRALEAAATPGPWRYRRSIFPPSDKINYAYVSFGKDSGESGLGTGTLSEQDARFLAAAVEYARTALSKEEK